MGNPLLNVSGKQTVCELENGDLDIVDLPIQNGGLKFHKSNIKMYEIWMDTLGNSVMETPPNFAASNIFLYAKHLRLPAFRCYKPMVSSDTGGYNSSLLHCKDHTHSWSTGRCIQLLQSGQNHEILAIVIAIIQGGIHHCLGKSNKCVKVIKTARRQVLHRLPHTPNASPGTQRGCPTSLAALRGTGCALSGDPKRSARPRGKRRSPAGRRATPNRQGTT